MKILILALALFVMGIGYGAPAGSKAAVLTRRALLDPNHTHPAPGTSIIRFGEVDKGIYRGSEPKNKADFRFLQSKHIKTIVNLEFWPLLSYTEEHKAKKYGMRFIEATINGSPVAPSEYHVDRILATLRDKRYHPIYFHCVLGRDRTGLIAALYKMYYLRVPQEQAWREMLAYGYKDSWTLGGLKGYLRTHPRPPRALASAKPLD